MSIQEPLFPVPDGLKLCRHPYCSTDEEIQRDLGLNPSTERPRRRELVRLGAVRAALLDDGSVWTRRTRSGCHATVWEVV